MQPGARTLHEPVGDACQGVAGPRVHVAGLGAHDERPLHAIQAAPEGIGVHAALGVGRHANDPLAAQPEVLEGGLQGGVRLVADAHPDLRRAEQAARLDVPALAGEDRVAGRGEGHDVRQPGPADEAEAGLGGQAQQVQHPGAGQLLHRGRGRGGRMEDGVLVPGGCQPVGSDRGGHGTADDEAEVARAARGDQAGLDGAGHLPDDGVRGPSFVLQRLAQGGHHGLRVDTRPDRSSGQSIEVPVGQLRGGLQHGSVVRVSCHRRLRLGVGRVVASRTLLPV